MKTGTIALSLVALFFWGGLAGAQEGSPEEAPAPAVPGAPEDAADEPRRRLARAHELFDAGDYRLALIEFERAYELRPSYRIFYNIGQVHFELGEYARAHAAFSRFLAEGGADVDPARRAAVEADLASLAKRIAVLTVEVDVEGATIALGDQPAESVKRSVVDAGSLRIAVSKPGYATETRVVKLAGGDERVERFSLVKLSPVVVAPPSAGLPPAAVVSWIVTGVLAAGAVGTGVGASAASNRFDQMRASPIEGSPEQAAQDLRRQGNLTDTLALTTDVLAVAAVVAGGVSLYLTLRPRPAQPAPARSAQASPFVFSF